MDKVIIFGIYEFVSFHACKTLLNNGVEVTGIQIDGAEDSPFLEEKRLEVGRNANFSERFLSELELMREEGTTPTTFLFSIYDLYMQNKEMVLQKEKTISPIIQCIKDYHNNANIVFILPIQMLRGEQVKTIETFIERVKGCCKNIQMVYLPAVYGPWQPSSYLYQQAILSKWIKQDIIIAEREWTGDVLFVEDAARTIIKTIETGHHGNFILESGKQNYWEVCADYLQIDSELIRKHRFVPFSVDHQIDVVSVGKVTPFAESISKQMDLVQRLYSKN
ncbi:hypothetical protein J1P26_16045 [Neobacillus sp. MM2021_6]|uniref:hypothetical protein n=1 Tax=Bacillaceae TaxID=186817 RepID=UPI00140D5933|nr:MULTISPECIES: hypothetical protein [Bacillaceae]MBO0961215.1 hypothetical protein [Neobacillus sp. MM2021_6]NHC20909.1 hypothetical protein [Bacillus sp. MM2020_4]